MNLLLACLSSKCTGRAFNCKASMEMQQELNRRHMDSSLKDTVTRNHTSHQDVEAVHNAL